MSKFDEMMSSGIYNELSDYVNQNNMRMSSEACNDKFIFTVMDNDSQNSLNGLITSEEFNVYVINKNGITVESNEKHYKDDNDLNLSLITALEAFKVLKYLDEDETSPEYKISELEVSKKCLEESFKHMSNAITQEEDVENISILTDIANNTALCATDINFMLNKFSSKIDDPDGDEDISEIACRTDIARSVIAMRGLFKIGKISDDELTEFESMVKRILKK